MRTAARGVRNRPGRLLLNIKFGVGEQLDQRRHDLLVDDALDLVLVTGGDVRDRPARFLLNTLLVISRQQPEQRLQSVAVDDDLSLIVVAGHDVPHRSKRRNQHARMVARQELHETSTHSSLDDGLNFVVRTVAKVRERPARISEHLLVVRVHQASERRKRRSQRAKVRLRFTSAKVRQSPRRVTEHLDLRLGVELREERMQRVGVQHQVAAPRTVARDVPECPNRLLAHVGVV